MTTGRVELNSDFPAVDYDQWQALAESTLKGGTIDGKLVHKTLDDLQIDPLYQGPVSNPVLQTRPAQTAWTVFERMDHPDPSFANKLALEALENGATGLYILAKDSFPALGFGIEGIGESTSVFEKLFKDIVLDAIELKFSGGKNTDKIIDGFLAYLDQLKVAPKDCHIDFGLSPYANVDFNSITDDIDSKLASFVEKTAELNQAGFHGPFFCADGIQAHENGATEVTELAFVLAQAVQYLRAIENKFGSKAPELISFSMSATADQFLTIAKFRALRRLWSRVLELSGLETDQVHIHAQTSWQMMSGLDEETNILRTGIATFAAGIGGANSMSVLPYTQANGLPNAFARRIARNTNTILIEESNIQQVEDAAAGSGYVENLTEQMALATWKQFQEIEAAGSLVDYLKTDNFQTRLKKANGERAKNIETGRYLLTGVNSFPKLDAKPNDTLLPAPDQLPTRLSEPLEVLRRSADQYGGTIFLAALGSLSQFNARINWAENYFSTGGLKSQRGEGGTDISAIVEEYRSSGSSIACICGLDEHYEELAEQLVIDLKKAGAKFVCLAGKEANISAPLSKAGVDLYIHQGCNLIETLKSVHKVLKIETR